jgi:hypothetical protein
MSDDDKRKVEWLKPDGKKKEKIRLTVDIEGAGTIGFRPTTVGSEKTIRELSVAMCQVLVERSPDPGLAVTAIAELMIEVLMRVYKCTEPEAVRYFEKVARAYAKSGSH